MRIVTILVVLVFASSSARADGSLQNWLIGPLVGVRLGGPPGDRLVIGFEGGYGFGPERFNVGFEYRNKKQFGYVEIDPWYILGATLGVGVDEDGAVSPVLGVWEGIPLNDPGTCSEWHNQLTLAGGYRYTGVHELYVTMKAGWMEGSICIH